MVAIVPRGPLNGWRNSQWKEKLTNRRAVATMVAGTSIFLSLRPQAKVPLAQKRMTPAWVPGDVLIDCISGSVGEVTALLTLYPLDTLKVQCQARSATLQAALQFIFCKGPVRASRLLYSGVGSAALGAAGVGALHLSLYHFVKRSGEKIFPREVADEGPNAGFSVLGAVFTSLVLSIVEAPCDQMKLQCQARAVGGSPMVNLMSNISKYGFSSVLGGSLLPFMMKSIPHDVGELVTFSALSENIKISSFLSRVLSPELGDALMGALSGAMAAIVSTPFDVICTKTNLSTPSGTSMRGSLIHFFEAARTEAAAGGIRAFYVGLSPRLLQMIPAGIIYWAVVESTRRKLVAQRQEAVLT